MNLQREAQRFADELTDLLNATVCHGIRLKCTVVPERCNARVGYEVDSLHAVSRGIPITLGKAPSCYIGMSFLLAADDVGRHLTVISSFIGLYCDRELEHCLFHYDYERNKGDGYPESHLQIPADSAAWRTLLGRSPHAKDALEYLHLPAGSRRFRPAVEDIVEFLIVERIAEARDGWEQALHASRDRFHRRQLGAAVRRRPDIAADQLREQGYRVDAPVTAAGSPTTR